MKNSWYSAAIVGEMGPKAKPAASFLGACTFHDWNSIPLFFSPPSMAFGGLSSPAF